MKIILVGPTASHMAGAIHELAGRDIPLWDRESLSHGDSVAIVRHEGDLIVAVAENTPILDEAPDEVRVFRVWERRPHPVVA